MLLILLGALSLGIVIGWLVRFFLDRLRVFNVKALASIVSILVGGVVAHFLGADPFRVSVWAYPIGLLIGILVYPLISLLDKMRPNSGMRDTKKASAESVRSSKSLDSPAQRD